MQAITRNFPPLFRLGCSRHRSPSEYEFTMHPRLSQRVEQRGLEDLQAGVEADERARTLHLVRTATSVPLIAPSI
jgi:hypothetical protein